LRFTYVINTGAAFSAFRGGVGWLKWLSLLVSLGLMAFAYFGPHLNRWEQYSLRFYFSRGFRQWHRSLFVWLCGGFSRF
jgi:signal peptidase II